MRYAIFSDIHGNRQAWEAVLADMEDLKVQVMVCLGDVVGYGPCPLEVFRAIKSRTDNIVMGNHDAAAVGLMDCSAFNPVAQQAINWTRGQLDEQALAQLSALPMAIESGDLLFVHAEAKEPGRFSYIETVHDAAENFAAREHAITFVGHTHQPTLFCRNPDGQVVQLADEDRTLDPTRRYIVNVGSVGEPRCFEDIRARYVIYDADQRKLYFRRIDFDPELYRADLLASGLDVSPFFLSVFDHQQAVQGADRAMTANEEIYLEAKSGEDEAIRELVVPRDVDGAVVLAGMPVPEPTPASRRRGLNPALLVLPLLVVLVVVVALLELRHRRQSEPDPVPPTVIIPWEPPAEPDPGPVSPRPEEPKPNENENESENVAVVEPVVPEAEPDSPPVAVVPEPATPEPESTPPAPDPVPKPLEVKPSVLDEAPTMTGLREDLLFYAAFDEEAGASQLEDQSQEGRNFPIGAAKLGEVGMVGLACRLEGGDGLLSEAKPLPLNIRDLTIAFWLLPGSAAPPAPGEEAPPMNPTNLVSINEYCELRFEGGQVVANLDRKDDVVRADFPSDGEWHHVQVENKAGITTIRIDGVITGEPRAEELQPVPAGALSVSIGSPEARFIIDEVAIWKRAFSSEECLNLFRRGRGGAPILTPARVFAQWSFHDEAGSRLIQDSHGTNYLGSYGEWKPVPAIAPDPVPLTLGANSVAAQVEHLAEEPQRAGNFRLTRDTPFTYEGWVKFAGGEGGTLGGATTAGVDGGDGWRVQARRDSGANGFLTFVYEVGGEKVQALARQQPLFDGLSHHFAVVWDPAHSESEGRMGLFLDNEEVASAVLAFSEIRTNGSPQFHIRASGAPMLMDELRFTHDVLESRRFLTAGLGASEAEDSALEGESLLERRDRELRERKQRQVEERLRAEEERRKAGEEKLREIEERRAEEEARRSRG